jgi:hypothetical protein
MLFQQFWRSSHICWGLVGCFSFILWSNSSQTISIGLKLGDCGGLVIWCSTPSLSFLVKCPYPAWRFVGSLSCWKPNDNPTKCKPGRMAYHWILNKSLTVSPAMHPHTITPPPCFTVETTHAEITYSVSNKDMEEGTKNLKFGLIRPKDRFPPV